MVLILPRGAVIVLHCGYHDRLRKECSIGITGVMWVAAALVCLMLSHLILKMFLTS